MRDGETLRTFGRLQTEVTARNGDVEVFTPRGSQWVRSGQTLMARGTAADPEFQVAGAGGLDDWDRWCESRDRVVLQSNSARYVGQGVYGAEDSGVVPPMAIAQTLPGFRGLTTVQRIGRIEIVVDETGAVESAFMTVSVTPTYDKMAVAAARNWHYTPATVNGAPVKFRKVVQITVKPTS